MNLNLKYNNYLLLINKSHRENILQMKQALIRYANNKNKLMFTIFIDCKSDNKFSKHDDDVIL